MTIEIDLNALERAAKAATPGEWEQHPLHKTAVRHPVFECWIPQTAEDAAFIAAANPAVVLELVRRLREVEKDAARYAFLRDNTYCSLSLSRNDDHSCNYVTAKQWIEEFETGEAWDDVPSDELQRMKDTNTIWALQIYPSTPIGFNRWSRSTLSAAIDAAMEEPK